jgi:hypothetical protein
MTTPLRKPHASLVSFEFQALGFDFGKGSTINSLTLCRDIVARQIFVRLTSGTFLSGLQKKPIETP